MATTTKRIAYKPIEFEWALEAFTLQNRLHWMAEEVSMLDDLHEFNNELTPHEKNIVTQILRFFTQSDVEIASCYLDYYIPTFQCIEIRMMLVSFAAMEAIHIAAYSFLLTSLKLPDTLFTEFLEYKEMVDKYNFMKKFNVNQPEEVALTLAIVSGGMEGFVLFSSFAVLMYFSTRRKKRCLSGMGNIVSFSIRDETLHNKSIVKLFHEYRKENADNIDDKRLEEKIYSNFQILAEHEFKFIDLIFQHGDLEDLSKNDVKDYIRYLVNIRLAQLGCKDAMFPDIINNPLPWMDKFLFASELAQFLESSVSSYSKLGEKNRINSAFEDF
jgi:ribonucleoside-diphosphate reductase beta chain